jgi:hypothetical protein
MGIGDNVHFMCTSAQEGCSGWPTGDKNVMSDDRTNAERVMAALQQALGDWARHGNGQPLTRWLLRELDSQGTPIRLPIAAWHDCLKCLLQAKAHHGDCPSAWDQPITRLRETTFWFTRRDGLPVTHFEPTQPNNSGAWPSPYNTDASLDLCAEQASEHRMSKGHPNHERAAWGGSNRVLAVLRPGWPLGDDFLAIDHREPGSSCRFELYGRGRSWLGPLWTIDRENATISRAKPRFWLCDPSADLAEWSYRAGPARISHTALVLRGRSLALLSVLVQRPFVAQPAVRLRVTLPPGITAAPAADSRAMLLAAPNKSGSAQVVPIGLPALRYPTDRGVFQAEDGALVLSQAARGRRTWLALLVSWDSQRRRRILEWRELTVSENSRKVQPEKAFAVRVSWGRDETYVIYRSLGPPAPRAFLGHQTTARFVVGLFKPDGTVEPILKVE